MRGLIDGLENPHPMLGALPAVYHEDSFSRRLTGVFDDGLAPIVSVLDNLDAYVDPDIAPRDFVEWLAAWVGFPIGETWPEDRSRQLVARAVAIYRWSGTVRGLKELLRIYAGVEPEVVDSGGVTWSTTPGGASGNKPAGSKTAESKTNKKKGKTTAVEATPEPHLLVRVRAKGQGGVDARQIEALINATKPAHVPHTLEVTG